MPNTHSAAQAATGTAGTAPQRRHAAQPQRAGMRTKEAAAYIGCGRTTLYRLVINGELHPVKIGRSTVFRVGEIDAMLEKAKQPGAVVGRGVAA